MYRKEKLYRRPEVLKLNFGERIRAVRKSVGKNQTEFSALLDIPQSTLSAYETDAMQPAIFNLVKIAKTFNVSMDWLCGLEKPQENNSLDGKSIGLRIRALRIERGLTQTEFAKSLGKALRTVQKYESGEIELTIATVNEIAHNFGVSAAYLLGSEVNADSTPPPTENLAPSVIILKGKDFSAEIPADVSPELLIRGEMCYM